MSNYLLDGEWIDVDDFLADNDLPLSEAVAVRNLQPGQSVRVGGGAAPLFVVSRDVACAPAFLAHGFRIIGTGGGHTGFSRTIGNVQTLVTSDQFDGFAPEGMGEPVIVGEYEGDELETQKDATIYASARAYLETL